MNAWDKQRHKKKGLGCYNLWSFRVRVWAGGGQPLKFQVTAPLRVRGCFFGVLLVSTWRFPGLGRGGGGGGGAGRGGGGNYVHWKHIPKQCRPDTQKQCSPEKASEPQTLKRLQTPSP